MQKDFQKRHALKSKIHHDHPAPEYREQEVWWCSLGANIGVEEDGKNDGFERPVLVIRKFNKEMFFGVPLTSRTKESIYHIPFVLHERSSTALLSQLRLWSAKRLIRRIGRIGRKQFGEIQGKVATLITKETAPLRGPRGPKRKI